MRVEHEYTEEIVCPWCGDVKGDSWERSDEGEDEQCDDCGGVYHYTRIVSVNYSSMRAKCDGKCDYQLKKRWGENPYVNDGKSWTIYECTVCKDNEVLTGDLAKDGLPYLIPYNQRSLNNE